ncbi:2-polyprenyl-6-methoxyphenol hydroxylase-like FAD-dependent oxidoreductase [Roseiarcus fermentans]|uniref:2-polyprenyl-6-methoxyphenol hydroxylase-like FAD-dependent oxidoreductase n=1 Tax=Roseiarcus fermentans TaxID=1473586 RepID=A0A366EK73_9HYPH|nr:FAD-binding domain [Roseiarcus fermentans]RBP02822.1 2-polyprenyl-6-methoxyphenol hydroxylase-like FAD-dependent oxidoreductase [Roseiarcus fermentans]
MAGAALISGAGIAGPTLAYWLLRVGWTPTLIERAPKPRGGGYVIDFWGLGYDIAERMGLAEEIQRAGYHAEELRIVGDSGERKAGFGAAVFSELTGGRYVTVKRSDLAALLLAKVADRCEVVFGEEVVELNENSGGVEVRFRHGKTRRFDIVVGADGLHSRVRALAFGAEKNFEGFLGYVVAAFEARGYRPRDEDVYVIHNEPGLMLARFAQKDDTTLFLFVAAPEPGEIGDGQEAEEQKSLLATRLSAMRWREAAHVRAALESAESVYFDRVSQIRMNRWSKGRIALVGDAAFCPSLLAGQGAALAMTASYVLAGELARQGGDHTESFRAYQMRLHSFVDRKQRSARGFARAFAPRTRFGILFRNAVVRATAIPGLSRLVIARDVADRIVLPDYP